MSPQKTKKNSADDQRFNEIEKLVTTPANRQRLQAVETTDEVRTIADDIGVDTSRGGSDMGKFIYKLKIIGVDFKAMARTEAAQRRAVLDEVAGELDERANDLPVVRLWSAAAESPGTDDDTGSFAVLDANDIALQYGSFHPQYERIRKPGDLVSGEQSAAYKAVITAVKAREAAQADEISLWLTTTCPDLNAASLKRTGARGGVAVSVIVDDADQSAVYQASESGYRSLKTVSDEELAALVERDIEVDDADDEGTEPVDDGGDDGAQDDDEAGDTPAVDDGE